MKSLYKILSEQNQKARIYFENYILYGKEIKNLAKELLSDARVLIFGSVIHGKNMPDSDIDILIISSEIPEDLFGQSKIKVRIKEKFPDAPFEIHLSTPEEYKNWYNGFIKKDYIEI